MAEVIGGGAVSLEVEAVVSHVLATLPKRYVPARSLLTVCVELLVALIQTWLTVESEELDTPRGFSSGTAPDALSALVGSECAAAWHSEAQDRLKRGEDRGQLLEALLSLMDEFTSTADRPTERRLGASWVLAALDDILGAVVAHCANKPAAASSGASQRPGSASASRPGTATRPGTGRSSGPAGSSDNGSRPTSSGGTPSSSRLEVLSETGRSIGALTGEKHRLIALKHLVATVRQERSLQACKVLEVCLVEVANGAAPLVAVDSVMVLEAYRDRLRAWATQEMESSGCSLDQCIEQAMKGVTSAPPRSPAAAHAAPKSAASNKASVVKRAVPKVTAPPPALQSRAGGWLPKAFVRDFNAEGDEVEAEVEELLMPPEPAAASLFSPEPRRAGLQKKRH